jgi:hypothetical protein
MEALAIKIHYDLIVDYHRGVDDPAQARHAAPYFTEHLSDREFVADIDREDMYAGASRLQLCYSFRSLGRLSASATDEGQMFRAAPTTWP